MGNSRIMNLLASLNIGSDDNLLRVFLTKDYKSNWAPIVLIISQGESNPLHDCEETYYALHDFLNEYDINMDQCTIYLDLMEYLGFHSQYLFKWNLFKQNNRLIGDVEPIDVAALPELHATVFERYYNEKWSVFKDSLLTNNEKAELIAKVLVDTIWDEYSLEDTQAILKYKLMTAFRKNKVLVES